MKKLLWVGIVLAIAALVFYGMQRPQPAVPEDYYHQIEQERKAKDEQFKSDPSSPFAGDTTFTGLKYFPVDPAYRIQARFLPVNRKQIIALNTSDGKVRNFRTYGYAVFAFNNQEYKLLILESMDLGPLGGALFLPFGDATSAHDTYGGGRYLDVKREKGSASLILDFNRAYNPYCAYNHQYSCPLPPPENLLPIPIRAGERIYHGLEP
jgi:uncharacterized protein (DUF1684 family)